MAEKIEEQWWWCYRLVDGTYTHEHRYGFHMGVDAGGPKNTCGLPVTSTSLGMVQTRKKLRGTGD